MADLEAREDEGTPSPKGTPEKKQTEEEQEQDQETEAGKAEGKPDKTPKRKLKRRTKEEIKQAELEAQKKKEEREEARKKREAEKTAELERKKKMQEDRVKEREEKKEQKEKAKQEAKEKKKQIEREREEKREQEKQEKERKKKEREDERAKKAQERADEQARKEEERLKKAEAKAQAEKEKGPALEKNQKSLVGFFKQEKKQGEEGAPKYSTRLLAHFKNAPPVPGKPTRWNDQRPEVCLRTLIAQNTEPISVAECLKAYCAPNHAQIPTSKQLSIPSELGEKFDSALKLTSFHDSIRPAYYGTCQRTSETINGRALEMQKDPTLNYEVFSEDDWDDEPEGEDIMDEDLGDDQELEEDGDEEGWMVDDGYLSAEEMQLSGEEGVDADEMHTTRKPRKKKRKLEGSKIEAATCHGPWFEPLTQLASLSSEHPQPRILHRCPILPLYNRVTVNLNEVVELINDVFVLPIPIKKKKEKPADDKQEGTDTPKKESKKHKKFDPNALFCWCRQPEKGFMIHCDSCNEWFHGSCVGITDKKAQAMNNYQCAKCKGGVKPVTPKKKKRERDEKGGPITPEKKKKKHKKHKKEHKKKHKDTEKDNVNTEKDYTNPTPPESPQKACSDEDGTHSGTDSGSSVAQTPPRKPAMDIRTLLSTPPHSTTPSPSVMLSPLPMTIAQPSTGGIASPKCRSTKKRKEEKAKVASSEEAPQEGEKKEPLPCGERTEQEKETAEQGGEEQEEEKKDEKKAEKKVEEEQTHSSEEKNSPEVSTTEERNQEVTENREEEEKQDSASVKEQKQPSLPEQEPKAPEGEKRQALSPSVLGQEKDITPPAGDPEEREKPSPALPLGAGGKVSPGKEVPVTPTATPNA